MNVEWAAVFAVATGAVLIGFPVGVAVGYAWRARISRVHRVRYLVEREQRRAKPDDADVAKLQRDQQ